MHSWKGCEAELLNCSRSLFFRAPLACSGQGLFTACFLESGSLGGINTDYDKYTCNVKNVNSDSIYENNVSKKR